MTESSREWIYSGTEKVRIYLKTHKVHTKRRNTDRSWKVGGDLGQMCSEKDKGVGWFTKVWGRENETVKGDDPNEIKWVLTNT